MESRKASCLMILVINYGLWIDLRLSGLHGKHFLSAGLSLGAAWYKDAKIQGPFLYCIPNKDRMPNSIVLKCHESSPKRGLFKCSFCRFLWPRSSSSVKLSQLFTVYIISDIF